MGLFKANGADVDVAEKVVRHFYTRSNNSDGQLLEAADSLSALRLSRDQLSNLRMTLPIAASGTNGEKVARIDRVLKRLEKEKN